MTKPQVSLLLSVGLLAPTVVYADNNHPEFKGEQTGPNEWTYTLKFAGLVNYSVFPVATSKTNLTTITVTGLFGVFAATGPTSTDFPGNLNIVNLDWSASVLDSGTKVVYTQVGPGTGKFFRSPACVRVHHPRKRGGEWNGVVGDERILKGYFAFAG